MISPITGCGLIILNVASYKSQIVNPQMNMTLTSVPMISDLWYPKERDLVAGLCAIFNEMIEMANPIMSDAKWAESVKMAMDCAR